MTSQKSAVKTKKKQTNQTKLQRATDFFHTIDLFGHEVSLRENGKTKLRTTFGTLVSLAIFVLIAIYGSSKFQIMVTLGDTKY